MNNIFEAITAKIQQYQKIIIFTHAVPDFDALGSQFGLYYFLKENFPDKIVLVSGDNHPGVTGTLYPFIMPLADNVFDDPFLAIIVDTSLSRRISDQRFSKAESKIMIDHHIIEESYGDINLQDPLSASAGELLVEYLISTKLPISQNCAKYLFAAIVGDTGRFLHSSTTPKTFALASVLIETGLDYVSEVYTPMYTKPLSSLDVISYILNNYKKTKKNVCYYIMEQDVLDKFRLDPGQGKEHLNLFSGLDEVPIWLSITKEEDGYRVSIRARVNVNEVAKMYRGGGHKFASGAKLLTLDELPALLDDLDRLVE